VAQGGSHGTCHPGPVQRIPPERIGLIAQIAADRKTKKQKIMALFAHYEAASVETLGWIPQ